MNFELRLKLLKRAWDEIQSLREDRAKAIIKAKQANEKVRSLSQEIPKKLDKYNQMMV